MILLSLDFESTGLDTANDDIIEFGAVLWSTTQKKCLDNQGMLVKTDKIITSEITRITGITKQALDRFAYPQDSVLDIILEMMSNAQAIIGYNVRRFDRSLLEAWAKRVSPADSVPEKTWIDLMQDLPWNVPVGKLSHTAADHGILNLFPHSALADCQTVLAIADKYDADLLLKRAQSPVVILRSQAPRTPDNQENKAAKFRWNPGRKIWWKAVKQDDVDEVVKSVPFNVSIEKELTQEELN